MRGFSRVNLCPACVPKDLNAFSGAGKKLEMVLICVPVSLLFVFCCVLRDCTTCEIQAHMHEAIVKWGRQVGVQGGQQLQKPPILVRRLFVFRANDRIVVSSLVLYKCSHTVAIENTTF